MRARSVEDMGFQVSRDDGRVLAWIIREGRAAWGIYDLVGARVSDQVFKSMTAAKVWLEEDPARVPVLGGRELPYDPY